MAIPLIINGVTFNYPVDFDENWGVAATGWAQAVTSGMLQMAGGSFPLTADVNFGANFGLLSKYFTSRTANPATIGTLRLASADPGIGFRNNANSANLILTTDTSDNLLYNGHVIAPSAGGPLPVSGGGTGDTSLTAYSVLCGGTTSTGVVQSVASVGTAGQVLTSNGAGAMPTFTNATGTGTVNSGTTPNIAYYATTSSILSDSGISRANLFLADGTVSATGALNLGSHKITNLANGSSAQDAVAFTQLSSGNAITAGGIAAATITATQIANATITASQIANATITTTQVASNTVTGSTANSGGSAGNLSQGTVSTPDLRANAVTQTQAALDTNSTVNSTSITSKSITTVGGPVLIMATYSASILSNGSAANLQLTVDRGGTAIHGGFTSMSRTTASTTQTELVICTVDTPVAGTYTYVLRSDSSTGVSSTNGFSLVLVELRA